MKYIPMLTTQKKGKKKHKVHTENCACLFSGQPQQQRRSTSEPVFCVFAWTLSIFMKSIFFALIVVVAAADIVEKPNI